MTTMANSELLLFVTQFQQLMSSGKKVQLVMKCEDGLVHVNLEVILGPKSDARAQHPHDGQPHHQARSAGPARLRRRERRAKVRNAAAQAATDLQQVHQPPSQAAAEVVPHPTHICQEEAIAASGLTDQHHVAGIPPPLAEGGAGHYPSPAERKADHHSPPAERRAGNLSPPAEIKSGQQLPPDERVDHLHPPANDIPPHLSVPMPHTSAPSHHGACPVPQLQQPWPEGAPQPNLLPHQEMCSFSFQSPRIPNPPIDHPHSKRRAYLLDEYYARPTFKTLMKPVMKWRPTDMNNVEKACRRKGRAGYRLGIMGIPWELCNICSVVAVDKVDAGSDTDEDDDCLAVIQLSSELVQNLHFQRYLDHLD